MKFLLLTGFVTILFFSIFTSVNSLDTEGTRLRISIGDDTDGDGVIDVEDNCPNDSNVNQEDLDFDNIGDICDNDDDNDGVLDTEDNCPNDANANQLDDNNDGIGNVCDSEEDSDGDGIPNNLDNCPNDSNVNQEDLDFDNIGDICDNDDDNDGVLDDVDNCPINANADQEDLDLDGVGSICDSNETGSAREEDDESEDEEEDDEEKIETFEVEKNQYFPELVNKDQLKASEDLTENEKIIEQGNQIDQNLNSDRLINQKDDFLEKGKVEKQGYFGLYFWWSILFIVIATIVVTALILSKYMKNIMVAISFFKNFLYKNKSKEWGKVFDVNTGKLVSDINIQLVNPETGLVEISTMSDSKGAYKFPFEEKEYKILINDENFTLKSDFSENEKNNFYTGEIIKVDDNLIQQGVNLAVISKKSNNEIKI